jgi:hypothetical protein
MKEKSSWHNDSEISEVLLRSQAGRDVGDCFYNYYQKHLRAYLLLRKFVLVDLERLALGDDAVVGEYKNIDPMVHFSVSDTLEQYKADIRTAFRLAHRAVTECSFPYRPSQSVSSVFIHTKFFEKGRRSENEVLMDIRTCCLDDLGHGTALDSVDIRLVRREGIWQQTSAQCLTRY